MKKILITGANGFIGRNLYEGLSECYQVFAPRKDELNLLHQDKVEKYLKENKFDIIIHSGNQNCTRNTVVSEYEILDRNMRMFFNLERCNKYFERMYYFGSGAEYDTNNYRPKMKEDYFGKFIPSDPYGFSKYIMSKIAEKDNNIYDLRLFGVFGKYEEWERRFISNAICRCICDLPVTIRQNVYFDYIYIDDLVKIMKWFIENKPKKKHYNVCTGEKIDLLSIAKKVVEISGKKIEILISKPGYKLEYSGCNDRVANEIQNLKFNSLEVSIKSLYKYYLENKKCLGFENYKFE